MTIGRGRCFAGWVAAIAMLAIGPHAQAQTVAIQHGTLRVDTLDRSYLFYVPTTPAAHPALVIALHGSGGDGQSMRISTGMGFERIASRRGFLVVYPDGYRKNWDDCRKRGTYPARQLQIDDERFLLALIARFKVRFNIDTQRVFVVGYSNGAQMAYRMALEVPTHIDGIAAIAAGLPTDSNNDCHPAAHSVPVMILNGTADPLNPFNGGDVSLFGAGDRGTVMSSRASAEYFAAVDHQTAPTTSWLPHQLASDTTRVEEVDWHDAGKAEVLLVTVHGGGHVVPNPVFRAPAWLGPTTNDLNAPAEIMRFFSRQAPAP